MTDTLLRFKPVLLVVAILAGIAAECGKARADTHTETAIVAGGCFWCVEADFERVRGVVEVRSGFSGGEVANPTYRQVVNGGTGHLEAVEIEYDPAQISYEQILSLFMRSIDPTDAGGQFCDRGKSYSTAIFVADADERRAARAAIRDAERDLGRDVVTPILDFDAFYLAEDYHQDYYRKTDLVITRRGPKTKADAYKFYRNACGRDDRVRELWGDDAPFVGKG